MLLVSVAMRVAMFATVMMAVLGFLFMLVVSLGRSCVSMPSFLLLLVMILVTLIRVAFVEGTLFFFFNIGTNDTLAIHSDALIIRNDLVMASFSSILAWHRSIFDCLLL